MTEAPSSTMALHTEQNRTEMLLHLNNYSFVYMHFKTICFNRTHLFMLIIVVSYMQVD